MSSRAALERDLARRMGAGHARIVRAADVVTLANDLGVPAPASVLTGPPVQCLDLRELSREAHGQGGLLCVDVSPVTSFCCSACVPSLGADVCLEGLGDGLVGVGVARNAQGLEELVERLSAMGEPTEEALRKLELRLQNADAERRRSSDAAQVVASYLVCHPRVAQVAYPGLKRDASFEAAARMLRGGFGPVVDYLLAGDEGWRRIVCTPEDSKDQVLLLERELRKQPLIR